MALVQDLPEFSWSVFTWQMIIISSIFLWIYGLKEISKHKLNRNKKVYWILIVTFLPILGPTLYLILAKQNRMKY